MLKVFYAILAVSMSTQAIGSDWRLVSTSSDGDKTYLDFSTIVKDGSYRTTWEKNLPAKHLNDGSSYSVGHWRYSCTDRTYTLLGYMTYNSAGSIVHSNQISIYNQETRDIAPDTTAEALLNVICS